MPETNLATAEAGKKVLMTTEEVAKLLGLEVNTLTKWRTNKTNGPPWIYLGKGKRSVRYDPDDVAKFIADNKTHPNIVT